MRLPLALKANCFKLKFMKFPYKVQNHLNRWFLLKSYDCHFACLWRSRKMKFMLVSSCDMIFKFNVNFLKKITYFCICSVLHKKKRFCDTYRKVSPFVSWLNILDAITAIIILWGRLSTWGICWDEFFLLFYRCPVLFQFYVIFDLKWRFTFWKCIYNQLDLNFLNVVNCFSWQP